MKAANHAPHNHDRRNSNNPHHSHSHGHSHHHDSTHTNQHSIHHNPHQPLKITSTWNRILDKLELSIEQQNLCNKPTKIYVYNKKSKSYLYAPERDYNELEDGIKIIKEHFSK